MIIESLEVVPLRLRLLEPFAVAGGSRTHIDTIVVRLRLDDGSVGWGEAAPDEVVTGETLDTSAEVLRDVVAGSIVGVDLAHPSAVEELVDGCAPGAPAARAALDIALHDLIARRRGLPLWRYLAEEASGLTAEDRSPGLDRAPVLRVSRVVSMASPTDMAADARRHVDAGFSTVKVKVGDRSAWELDVQRVAAVRAAVGDEVGIKVDVNQAWRGADVAVPAMEAMAASRPLFVEQPVDRNDLDGLAEVRRRVPDVPVMADESIRGERDVARVSESGAADLVNLKVMRIGGLRETMRAALVAAAAGIGVQVGTMIESSIGSAAGLHLAAALGAVVGADGGSSAVGVEMGGPLMLAEDVADLAACYAGEIVTLPTGPGLGVQVRAPGGRSGRPPGGRVTVGKVATRPFD